MEAIPSDLEDISAVQSTTNDADIARTATQEVTSISRIPTKSDSGEALAEATYLGAADSSPNSLSHHHHPQHTTINTADFLQHYVGDQGGTEGSFAGTTVSSYPTIFTTINYSHPNYTLGASNAGNEESAYALEGQSQTSAPEETLSYNGGPATIVIPTHDGQHLFSNDIVKIDQSANILPTSSSSCSPPGKSNYDENKEESRILSGGSSVSSPPNISYATRVSQATIHWLISNYETSEGVSLPRSTLYLHYQNHCLESKQEPVNAASFGKLIRSVFIGLRTRRIGTRGNSKYHYYGIRVKPGSKLDVKYQDRDIQSTTRQAPPIKKRCHASSISEDKNFANDNDSSSSTSNNQDIGTLNHHNLHQTKNLNKHFSQYFELQDEKNIPHFPSLAVAKEQLPPGLDEEDIEAFKSIYFKHLISQLACVRNCDFNGIEEILIDFWSCTSEGNKFFTEDLEKYLIVKKKFISFLNLTSIRQFIKEADSASYQRIVDIVVPNVLKEIPNVLTQLIRTFAKQMEGWMEKALKNHDEGLLRIKMKCVKSLSLALKRYTGLNHLAQAAQAVFKNGSQIQQMVLDINKVDFSSVRDNCSWVCGCDHRIIAQFEDEFKTTLKGEADLETWAGWLESVIDRSLNAHKNKRDFFQASRKLLLRWSFYSSMIIRDLTLRSATSFGSFHLIRLLYDEYVYYAVERKVASHLNTVSISLLGSPRKDEIEFHSEFDESLRFNGRSKIDIKEEFEMGILDECEKSKTESFSPSA